MFHTITISARRCHSHLDEEEQSLFPALLSHARMRSLAADYVAPDWACGSYETLMRELDALETDTFAHVHAETHVLMPRFTSAARPHAPAPLEAAS